MNILIDKRIQRFIVGELWGENDDIMCIMLKDIEEAFWFVDEVLAQDFLNIQAIERVYDKELRKGYFDYVDEYGATHRYYINKLVRGKITSFTEEIIEEVK